MESFGQRLKSLRKEMGLTQVELAEKLNLDKSTVAKYETDKIKPSLDMLITFAKFFHVTCDYLVGMED